MVIYSFKEMLLVLPPIFILIGLLDVWIPKETMIRLMGEGSGIKGVLLAFLFGTVAVGPLYAAFPVAIVFVKIICKIFKLEKGGYSLNVRR